VIKKVFRKEYSYKRSLPKNYKSQYSSRFDEILNCLVSEASIVEFTNAKVLQYYVFSGRKLQEDFCLPIQLRGKQNVLKQLLKFYLFPKKKINEAIWVIDLWSKNYFHWILECFPRILTLKEAGIDAPLMIPQHLYKVSYIRESLEELGIEVIPFRFRQSFEVAKLYTVTHDSPCAFDIDYLKKLQTFFLQNESPSAVEAYRKIYISRREASKRRIINEADLEPILLEQGFEIVQMEKLNFRQQRALMRESKVLLSSHGAGFTNMLFMPAGSIIIELHPNTERYNSCFYHLSAALNLDYYCSFEQTDHENPQVANLTINVDSISKLLNSV
jgi:capsular polysaccharide biosynthesis protein